MDRTDRPRTDGGVWHPAPGAPDCPHCAAARPSTPGSGFDWSFLDAAYCISLRDRADRATVTAAEFHRIGLCARTTFLRLEKDPVSVRVGIWQSHRRVAEHALGRGGATVLICEDDLKFSRRTGPHAVRAVGEALRALPRDWMVLYLGHWPLWAYFVRPNVLRCGSACCHAYIASERMLRWLRDTPPDSVPIARIAGRGVDAAFARLPATYAIFPMLAIQRPGRSDNMGLANGRRKKKVKHLITRSRHRERLFSSLMRPNEILIALLSPLFFLLHRWRRASVPQG